MRHGVDEDAQIGSDGIVVDKVPDDDSEDKPAMKRMSRLVWRRGWQVTYVACKGRRSSRPGTTEAGEPAEFRNASESVVMVGVEEAAGAESMPVLE
jgi:hypothetical protein